MDYRDSSWQPPFALQSRQAAAAEMRSSHRRGRRDTWTLICHHLPPRLPRHVMDYSDSPRISSRRKTTEGTYSDHSPADNTTDFTEATLDEMTRSRSLMLNSTLQQFPRLSQSVQQAGECRGTLEHMFWLEPMEADADGSSVGRHIYRRFLDFFRRLASCPF